MRKEIQLPLTKEQAKTLKAGDMCFATGVLYTARDAAHKRMYDSLLNGEEIPISLEETALYYLGPTPAREGNVIGSAGPTTASRMDKYTPLLLGKGVSAVIGKGKRNEEVHRAIKEHGAVYFAAIGGAGALLSKCIKKAEVIAYDDLGTEAIRRLEVEQLPVVVIIDTMGNDYYEMVEKE
ncbi:MAG: Fe-S-containing hydro-lyase [Lachnospiraceae bacterium]|nr:Fe-S-containing hydro-lyase [Lachnospiraceae bacterium]